MSSTESQRRVGLYMASERVALMMIAVAWITPLAAAAATREHTVGRRAGWTIPAVGNVNYSTWAAGFTFSVGDVLVFKYDTTLHDVLQVFEGDYNNCDASRPLAKYNDGNSSIILDKVGSWFFICGVPGHCLAGQKLQVQVSLPMPLSMAPNTNFGTPLPSAPSSSPSLPSQQILGSPTPAIPPIINSIPARSSPSKAPTNPHTSSWSPRHSFEHILLVTFVFTYCLIYDNFL